MSGPGETVDVISPTHWSLRRSLLGLISQHRRDLPRLLGWTLLQALPVLLSGLLVEHAVGAFVADRLSSGFGWLLGYVLAVVVGAWGTRRAFVALADIVEPLRDSQVAGLVGTSLARATRAGRPGDGTATADVARLTGQTEIVREAVASVLLMALEFVLVSGAAVVGLVVLTPRSVVIVLPCLVLALALFGLTLRRLAVRQFESVVADERLAVTASVVESARRDIIAGGAESVVLTQATRDIEAQARAVRTTGRLAAAGAAAVGLGSWVPLVLVLGLGRWVLGSGLTAGALIGLSTYLLQGVQPALSSLVRGLSGPGVWLTVAWRRVDEAIETHPAAGRPASAGDLPTPNRTRSASSAGSAPAVELRGVHFRFGAAQPLVVSLDLWVADGEHVAIVGPSGVGKSTLANLMAGVLAPTAGSVSLAGQQIARRPPEALSSLRSLIPQQAYVFSGSVRENLGYLDPGVDDRTVLDAVDRLGASTLVERLGGLDAPIDARMLTAGERQLLTAVRAFIAPAPLVILDEATSWLDIAAEDRVERAFADRPGTLVTIVHRMSAARRADRIVVMDGTNVRAGTHDELVATSPAYRALLGAWTVEAATGASSPRVATQRSVGVEPLDGRNVIPG